MASVTKTPASVTGRFLTTPAQLGFRPPPVELRLTLLQTSLHWTLYVQPTIACPVGPLIEWLAPFAPLRVEFGSRNILRADFDPLPAEWENRFRSVEVESIRLAPTGVGVATVSGTRAGVAAFAQRLGVGGRPVEVRQVGASPLHARLLTKPQDDALREAVRAGYYAIPRPMNLRKLAVRMGISSASLSERLRRAEGHVITRYVNEGGKSPWDDRTLFDVHPHLASALPWATDDADSPGGAE